MKKQKAKFLVGIIALIISLNVVFALFPKQISAQQNDVNFQEFYDQLSPYGQWIEDSNYGYIWIPTAGPDFTPYLSNGYWVMTDYGWMWESDYSWGWAPFHYGRWDYNGSYGWFWVPDSEWGPSWVTWRRSEGYYGWAPMRPGVTISVTFSSENNVPNDRWIFVRDRDIARHDIGRNHISRNNNPNIMNHSSIIDKTYYDNKRHTTYVAGPGREDVQKITGTAIKPVSVHEKDKPGQILNNDQLQIYRPQIQKNNNGHKPAPSELTKLQDIKHISQRDEVKKPQNIQPPNNNTGIREQKPMMNIPNKINNKENTPKQPITNSAVNNINKGQQPAANPVNNIDNKNHVYQQRNLNTPKKEDKIVKTIQPQNPIAQKSNNIAQPLKVRTMIPPKNNRTDQPPRTQTMIPPKNNRTDQPARTQTMNPPKNNKAVQPAKSNQNDDKKEKQ